MEVVTIVASAIAGALAKEVVALGVLAVKQRWKTPERLKPWLTRAGIAIVFDVLILVGLVAESFVLFSFNDEPATKSDVFRALAIAFIFAVFAISLMVDLVQFALSKKMARLREVEEAITSGTPAAPAPVQR
jgi:hypothetical protein